MPVTSVDGGANAVACVDRARSGAFRAGVGRVGAPVADGHGPASQAGRLPGAESCPVARATPQPGARP